MRNRIVAMALTVGLLAGCTGAGPKESVGTLGGAALGGLLGAQIGHGSGNLAAVAAGTLLGGILGNQVGQSLDRADRMYAERAAAQVYTAPVGQPINWRNPDSGNSGSVVVTRDGTDNGGNYCREYQQTITVGGKRQQAYGTACRQADGSWKIIN
jgi:surface antigen